MGQEIEIIRPGYFGLAVRADARRAEFDAHNESILASKQSVDAVFIGDSLTEYWALPVFFHTANLLVNRGIGGDTTTYMVKRYAADVLQLKPQFTVIMGGINNTGSLDSHLKVDGSLLDALRDEIGADIRLMASQSLMAGSKPVICSLLPTCNRLSRVMTERNLLIVHINEQLQKIADELNCEYMDYHSQLCEADGLTLKSHLSNDGVHLGYEGYRLMANLLRQTLVAT